MTSSSICKTLRSSSISKKLRSSSIFQIEVVFHLPKVEVVFHVQKVEVVFHFQKVEVVFHFQKVEVAFHLKNVEVVFQICSYYIPVCLLGPALLISSYFTTIPGGQPDAGYFKNKANLSLQAKLDLKLRLSLAKTILEKCIALIEFSFCLLWPSIVYISLKAWLVLLSLLFRLLGGLWMGGWRNWN